MHYFVSCSSAGLDHLNPFHDALLNLVITFVHLQPPHWTSQPNRRRLVGLVMAAKGLCSARTSGTGPKDVPWPNGDGGKPGLAAFYEDLSQGPPERGSRSRASFKLKYCAPRIVPAFPLRDRRYLRGVTRASASRLERQMTPAAYPARGCSSFYSWSGLLFAAVQHDR